MEERRILNEIRLLVAKLEKQSQAGGDVEHAFNLHMDLPKFVDIRNVLELMSDNVEDETRAAPR